MNSLIAQTKIGDCSRCPATNTKCKKRGKNLVCLYCCNSEDVLKQMDKAKKKHALQRDTVKVKKLGLKQDLSYKEKEIIIAKGAALERWFKDRRKEMTGRCRHCNSPSCKHSDQYFKYSICHILPKAYFPSVATHEYNWIELCFWKNNCHGNMDNKMLDLIDMNCFDEIVTKFCIMYPDIAPDERRRIPAVLLQYVEVEK